MEVGYFIIGFCVILIVIAIAIYNRIIKRKNEIDNAFGSIDAMLKKRFDLLPNLVEVTKQFIDHEKSLLREITTIRTNLEEKIPSSEKVKNYNKLNKHAESIMLNVENYPDLKSNENFIILQKAWSTSEEQIAASRRFYNTTITAYNNAIQTFPSNLIAKLFNFNEETVFEIEQQERENINAKELFK